MVLHRTKEMRKESKHPLSALLPMYLVTIQTVTISGVNSSKILVGEVTRLAVVEKWPAFTCKITTPGSWGDVTRHCCKYNMNSTPARQVTPP